MVRVRKLDEIHIILTVRQHHRRDVKELSLNYFRMAKNLKLVDKVVIR